MLLHNYIAKFYDVYVRLPNSNPVYGEPALEGDEFVRLELDVLGEGEESAEPLGWLTIIPNAYRTEYVWSKIYSNVPNGTRLTEQQVRQMCKEGRF